jgi:hypothetical protein
MAIMMFVKSLTVLSLVGGVSIARAEEDLMKILEGNGAPVVSYVEGEDIQKLKKAVNPQTGDQNIFFQNLVDKNYEKALFQWALAFNGQAFGISETGKALEAYLYYKNGLKLTGVESLLAIKEPQKIDATVLTMWKETSVSQEPVWNFAQVQWQPFWTETFGKQPELAVLLQKNYVNEDVAALTELIKRTQPDTKERAILQWQLVLNLGIKGDSAKAAQVLAHLMKVKNNPIDPDLMTITAGRLLYQNGFLDASLKYYQKISKKSDYWFQAQEEMAWAYMRKGEPQNAIALTKTLTYPHFKGWVGMESYLLDSFSRLKVCDYSAVTDTMRSIKKQFGDHLVALEKLTQSPHQKAAENLVKGLSTGVKSTSSLEKNAHELPLNSSKDEVLAQLAQRHRFLSEEASNAEKLYSKSLAAGSLQGTFESLKSQIQSRAQESDSASYQRIQDLAKLELEDSKQVMQRLRIVEVEMIQQVDSAAKLLKNAGPAQAKIGNTGSDNKHAMSFASDKDVWFDELSNFKVGIKKGCSKEIVKE